MVYAGYNNKYSNDNIWESYIETHRYNKVYEGFNHMSDYEKEVKNEEINRKKSIVDR